jgi:predicted DNA-binding transcriptional regulator YafY
MYALIDTVRGDIGRRPDTEIAAQLGVSRSTISRVRRRLRLRRPPKEGAMRLRRGRILALLEQRPHTVRELHELLRVPEDTIRRDLNALLEQGSAVIDDWYQRVPRWTFI